MIYKYNHRSSCFQLCRRLISGGRRHSTITADELYALLISAPLNDNRPKEAIRENPTFRDCALKRCACSTYKRSTWYEESLVSRIDRDSAILEEMKATILYNLKSHPDGNYLHIQQLYQMIDENNHLFPHNAFSKMRR